MIQADELTVDLVVGSVGRFDCWRRLMTSLISQSHRNFRLIVIEQVDPAGAEDLLAQFPTIRSQVLTSERGLSRARNRDLKECSAEIVALPDDDCWFDVDTLAKVAERFVKERGQSSTVATHTGRSAASSKPAERRACPDPD
jgi:glycosyltransferase involved in cell wall biosynthesis